jgi:hypothetical protein
MKVTIPRIRPHLSLELHSMDTIAECFPVSDELSGKLWQVLSENCKPISKQIDIENSCPNDAIGLNTAADHWDKFTNEEKIALNEACKKEDEAF